MQLTKKDYNSKIKLYSNQKLDLELAEKIINYLFYGEEDRGEEFTLIKNDRKGTEVFKLDFKGETYYLKKYFYRKTIKRVKNLFREVEAIRHFKTANKLLDFDISTINPVLTVTFKRNLFTTDNIFVTKESKGIDLYNYLKNYNYNYKNRKILIKRMAKLWAKLLNNNFLHRDPTLENFLINKDLRLSLVDIDHLYHLPVLFESLIIDALVRFNAESCIYFDKTNSRFLSRKERVLFLTELIEGYEFKSDYKTILSRINQGTIKKLIKWNREDLVNYIEV
ncbi:hypothetical protein MWH28_02950 [Natroniella sulfidigena]|uniref:lipopolysaccharide kinase InaA family protein n=1 Tax=Natroniella sulfidigena TaxID=723921 RepID=UPI00200B6E12|nr:lipopolysaccharide kinase InaA family protein [Natroniella sulfidigena]MCK8816321.1 hypothetical protein [Natroniella sulfidigena]